MLSQPVKAMHRRNHGRPVFREVARGGAKENSVDLFHAQR